MSRARGEILLSRGILRFAITLPIALAHARGDLLDVGAGHVPFRRHLQERVNVYHTLDREKRVEDIDFVSDARTCAA